MIKIKIHYIIIMVLIPFFGSAQWFQTENIQHERSGGVISVTAISDDGLVYANANASRSIDPTQPGTEGAIQLYQKVSDTNWEQIGDDIFGEMGTSERLGVSISLNANGKVMVATTDNKDVYVYELNSNGDNWVKTETMSNGDFANSGREDVEINNAGTIIAYGSGVDGIIRFFEKSGGNWAQMGSDLNGLDGFGSNFDLSADGKTIVVRRFNFIEIYTFLNGNWQLVGDTIDYNGNDFVSISDDGNIIASTNGTNVSIYSYENGTWEMLGEPIPASHPNSGLSTGIASIDLNGQGNMIAIGEPGSGFVASTGYVFFHTYQNNSWVADSFIASENSPNMFADSMELSSQGNVVAIGEPLFHKSFVYEAPTLSIIKNTFNQEIKYFPNPVIKTVNIKLNKILKKSTAVIYSVDGKILKEENFRNKSEFIIPIDYPSGIYFIHLKGDNQEESIIKILKK